MFMTSASLHRAMRRTPLHRACLAFLLLQLAALFAAPRSASAASLQEVRGFGNNPSNARMFIYVPDKLAAAPPVLVAIHYCGGNANAYFTGTGYRALADQYGFIVVYPQTTSSDGCFDVHSDASLEHDGGGDSASIVSMVRYALDQHMGDASRVYVTGTSSGAMMTNVLLGAYPDVFRAGAAFAGVPYGCFAGPGGWNSACADGKVTKTGQAWGDLVRAAYPGYTGPRPRVQLWHGDKDETLDFHNFGEAIKQWTNVLGVSETPTSTEQNTPQRGWTRTRYADAAGIVRVEAVLEAGMTHNLTVLASEVVRFFGLDGKADPGGSGTGGADAGVADAGMASADAGVAVGNPSAGHDASVGPFGIPPGSAAPGAAGDAAVAAPVQGGYDAGALAAGDAGQLTARPFDDADDARDHHGSGCSVGSGAANYPGALALLLLACAAVLRMLRRRQRACALAARVCVVLSVAASFGCDGSPDDDDSQYSDASALSGGALGNGGVWSDAGRDAALPAGSGSGLWDAAAGGPPVALDAGAGPRPPVDAGGAPDGAAPPPRDAGSPPGGGGPLAPGRKFIGNITTNGQVRSDFAQYWDQITPENEGKWGSVEAVRNQMNWAGLDRVHDYAKQHGLAFKQHNMVWGNQQPGWLAGLPAAQQRAEVEEWIRLFCERYPDVALIDVVNEPPPHTTPVYMAALGGAGSSGYDWIVQAFKWTRQYCPNAKLILNDYNDIEYGADNTRIINIVKAIKAAGAPIDAVGAQAHDAYKIATNTVQTFIDQLASGAGLPVYITEYDINLADDTRQQQIMQSQISMFWNHSAVQGITLWGYIVGATWRSDTGLMSPGGTKRPAMTWLVDFINQQRMAP
jgi:endo-1,4-beta-xylanase